MKINNSRVNKVVQGFLNDIYSYDLIPEYLDDVVYVTRKTAKKGVSKGDIAYVTKSNKGLHGNPTYKICLVKEEIEDLDNKQILNTLAHEMSHILLKLDRDNRQPESQLVVERVCDVLAECFFGYPKPEGSDVGYIFNGSVKEHN